jgi:hypothetical protein
MSSIAYASSNPLATIRPAMSENICDSGPQLKGFFYGKSGYAAAVVVTAND